MKTSSKKIVEETLVDKIINKAKQKIFDINYTE